MSGPRLIRADQIKTREDLTATRETLTAKTRTRVTTKAAHDWPTETLPEGKVALCDDVVSPVRIWAGYPERLVDDKGNRIDDGVLRLWAESDAAFWAWMLARGLAEEIGEGRDATIQPAPGVIVDGPVPVVATAAVLNEDGTVKEPAVMAPGVHWNVKAPR